MHILIVDDDPLFGALVTAILEDAGHGCRVMTDAREALAVIRSGEHVVDSVVSDLHMPGLDGLGLLRALREADIGLPFILLTAEDAATLNERIADCADVALVAKDQLLEQALPRALATFQG
ncbi:MAG: response regulator [Chromatiaceae bacterium]|nr:response regulator [Chromatiaceae bacterium]